MSFFTPISWHRGDLAVDVEVEVPDLEVEGFDLLYPSRYPPFSYACISIMHAPSIVHTPHPTKRHSFHYAHPFLLENRKVNRFLGQSTALITMHHRLAKWRPFNYAPTKLLFLGGFTSLFYSLLPLSFQSIFKPFTNPNLGVYWKFTLTVSLFHKRFVRKWSSNLVYIFLHHA